MEKNSIIDKIKALFSTEEETLTFIEVKTNEGKILRTAEMVLGSTITEITEDGEVEIENDEFVTEDGYTIVVKDGVIEDIKEPVVEEELEKEEVTVELANVMLTDGTPIYYGGTELVAGETALFLDEALAEPAPEGEHMLEGGLKITIENGVLMTIEEVVEEEEEVVNEFEVEVLSALENLKNEFESLKTENQKLKERFNKFASEPSEEPIETKVDFSTLNKKQTREERIKFFGKK